MTDGILLLAFGNPCYGYAAYNMAMSIRLNGCSLPVMLIHDGRQKIDMSVFDITEQIHITECAAYIKTECYFKSRFKNTLYLDVDGCALKDITPLFNQFKESGNPYQHYIHKIYNESDYEYPDMYWATRETIEKYYGSVVNNFPATQSSIQFYRKCEESDKLYRRVLDLINEPIPVSEMRNLWGGGQPDELYLNIALSENGIYPMTHNAMFFGNKISPLTVTQIQQKYYFLSLFGGREFTRKIYQDFYDRYMIKLMRSHNLEHRYKIPHIMYKKHADQNRHLITLTQRTKEAEKPFKKRYTVSPEKIHLITSYYKARTKERQSELDECLKRNIDDKEIDSITVFTECDLPFTSEKVREIRVHNRITFNKCVEVCTDDINIISNSDIYFENSNLIKQLDFNNHFAITRHDRRGRSIIYRPFPGSQDVWIGKGFKPIENDVEFGKPRCDQIIAYELNKQKRVLNPARTIICVHLHQSKERSYTQKDELKGNGMFVNDSSAGAFRKRMLIIQPGMYGDILIILPIAKYYYDNGYLVDILCPERFHDLFRNIDYATPVEKKEDIYSKIIDLSFGINPSSEVHYWWMRNKSKYKSFVYAKYDLAKVPYPQPLVWNRNIKKESELVRIIDSDKYTLVHEDYGITIPVDGVRVSRIEGYNIFDWYQVIMNASEIHCIDSGIANFIRYLDVKCPKYIYEGRNGGGEQMSVYDDWIKDEISV